MRILVIREDRTALSALSAGLAGDGHDVHTEPTREEGVARAAAEPFDAVVLDVSGGGRYAAHVAARLRDLGLEVPVVVLAANGDSEEHVRCLDSGADDYLVVPVTVTELAARLRALKRRASGNRERRLSAGDLEVDLDTRSTWRAGIPVELTAREFELLAYLLRHRGRVVTREMLARDVWQEASRGTPLDNVLAVHVARIRKKVHGHGGPRLIHTVRGVGFLVAADAEVTGGAKPSSPRAGRRRE